MREPSHKQSKDDSDQTIEAMRVKQLGAGERMATKAAKRADRAELEEKRKEQEAEGKYT